MPAEVIQVLALYIVAMGVMSHWLHQRGADLDKKISERVRER